MRAVRGIAIEFVNLASLQEALDRGERDRELGVCQQHGICDGQWLAATLRVGVHSTRIPVRARDLGDGLRLVLSERDWLRLREFAASCERMGNLAAPPSSTNAVGSGLAIVVSAEPAVGNVVMATLRSAGLDATTASSAREALERVTESRIDLLVVDGQLPDVSTDVLCSKLRNCGRPTRPAVLLLVSGQHGSEAREAIRQGADDFVAAPFRCQELLARVESLLYGVARGGLSGAA